MPSRNFGRATALDIDDESLTLLKQIIMDWIDKYGRVPSNRELRASLIRPSD